ncbi:hypothetical protein B2J93_4178 [Marssonina coronariae]|uniref:Uncharacterized protein n=1 Tax=Diplocarpon coronariae TaxID=2795749 RepID=A0A218ZAR7_9HELO|nr:hypothetical protein B2J93_4178 [Marssonina coronariae]
MAGLKVSEPSYAGAPRSPEGASQQTRLTGCRQESAQKLSATSSAVPLSIGRPSPTKTLSDSETADLKFSQPAYRPYPAFARTQMGDAQQENQDFWDHQTGLASPKIPRCMPFAAGPPTLAQSHHGSEDNVIEDEDNSGHLATYPPVESSNSRRCFLRSSDMSHDTCILHSVKVLLASAQMVVISCVADDLALRNKLVDRVANTRIRKMQIQ